MESKVNDVCSSAAASEQPQTIDMEIIDRDHNHFHIPTINNNVNRLRIDDTIIDISCNIQGWGGRADKYEKTQNQNQNRDKANVEAKNYNHDSTCQESGAIRKTLFQPTGDKEPHGNIGGDEHGKTWETRECRESNQGSCRRKQQEEETIQGTDGEPPLLPLSQNQGTDNKDNNDHRHGNSEAEFSNFTTELSELSHVKHLLSIEISTSCQNQEKYKYISPSTSCDTKPKTKREDDDWNGRKTEVFPSPNLCVEINVEQEPRKRENKFGDIAKQSTVLQFPSGTQPKIFPENNRRSQVIASTSSHNHGIKSYRSTSPSNFTSLSAKESEGYYKKPSRKQADSQMYSDTMGIKAGHQKYYEGTSISIGSQECQCFQEGCTVQCSVKHSAEGHRKIGNPPESKEEKLSDKAYTQSQEDYINEYCSKSTITKPHTLAVEPGTVSLQTNSDISTSYRSLFPRDRFTSHITHSTPVTDKSRIKSFSNSFNKSTSFTAILPRESSISSSTVPPSITDDLLGKASTSLTNKSTIITDSPPDDPSITNSDKYSRMTTSVPEEISESVPYKSSIITDFISKLLGVRGSIPKNLSESVSDKSKSVAEGVFDETSLPDERNFTERIVQVPTNKLLNPKQSLEHTPATSRPPCYLHTNKLPKCNSPQPSSHSTRKDFNNGKDPLNEPILKHHPTGKFTDDLPTGSGRDADIKSPVSWCNNEEPLLSSTKATETNKSGNLVAGKSEPTGLSRTSLCTSKSKLNNSSEKHNISKYTNSCTSNFEGFEDQNKNRDIKKEFLIYSETTFSRRRKVTGHENDGINNCDFNSNTKELGPSNEIRFPSTEACKHSKSTGLSDEPNFVESLCPTTDISVQQSHHSNQLRNSPTTSINTGFYNNSEKCPKYNDKTYTSDTCRNLNTSTDTFVGVVSGKSSGKQQKPQEEYERPKLRKVLWAVTRINIFEDESRTYEIMKPSEEPPTKIPEASECIFVVIPQNKGI